MKNRVPGISLMPLWLILCQVWQVRSFRTHSIGRWRRRSCLNAEHTQVILYHKSANTITSHSNADVAPAGKETKRRTVYEDVESMIGYTGPQAAATFQEATGIQSKLHAVGRLDADTTGLLLLTNDGGLVHHVTNPNAHLNSDASAVSKTYQAHIMGHHDEDSPGLEQIRTAGVDIGQKYGGMTKPAKELVVLGHPSQTTTLVSITIEEGKNRQIRRMFHAIQSGVMKLKRTSVGDSLTLNGVEEEGEWRLLAESEISSLGWQPRVLSPSLVGPRRRRVSNATQGRRKRKK